MPNDFQTALNSDVPHQGNALPKFHISVTRETNAPREPHR
jgi:hypothetical protein